MARARFFTDFERDVIRVGLYHGRKAPEIARFLGRTPVGVYQQIKAMRAAGTLENLPFGFVADDLAKEGGFTDEG